MPKITNFHADPARELRALVATADGRLAAWALARLPAAGVAVCDYAPDTERAIRLAAESRPDLCLLDVALADAMSALHAIREQAPATRVVILAAASEDPALLRALAAGASGCMVGTPGDSALKRALGDVLAGNAAIPRALLTRVVAGLNPA